MPRSVIRVNDGILPWALVTQVGAKGDTGSGGTGITDGDKGDVTVASSGASWTIKNDSVSNAKAANMAQGTIKGRASGAGTGDPTDLTGAQVKAIIGALGTSDLADDSVTVAKLGADVDTVLASKADLAGDNTWTGVNDFAPDSIDPAALGSLDSIIQDYNNANRIVSVRTYANGTTPAVVPNTLWLELGAGVTPTPTAALPTSGHQGSSLNQSTYLFDVGTLTAAAVYIIAIHSGDAATSIPADVANSLSGRGLTWAPIPDRSVSDGVTTSGSTTLTSATANFQTTDVGRLITGTGIPSGTRITARASTTSVTLSASATATATGVTIGLCGTSQANGTTSLILYKGTGTPDSSGNLTVGFPDTQEGCHIELIPVSGVSSTVTAAKYASYVSSGLTAPAVSLTSAPNSAHFQLCFLGVNNGSGVTSTDPGTPFGTSPDLATTSPSMRSRASYRTSAQQTPTWAKSDSGQWNAATVVLTPA